MFPFVPQLGPRLQGLYKAAWWLQGEAQVEVLIQGMQKAPPTPTQRLLGSRGSGAWTRSLFSPVWGEGRQPVGGSQVVAIFLMSFTSSSREWFSYCLQVHIHDAFMVYSEVNETETSEFGAEKGLL